MATTVFAVKRALKELSDTLPSLAGAQVSYGHPANEPERRSVQILKAEWESSEWATNRSRQEKYSVNVRCVVFIMAGTALDAETTVEELMNEFEDAVKANPSLGVPGVLTTSVMPREMDSAPGDGGWVAGIDYEVRVTARI